MAYVTLDSVVQFVKVFQARWQRCNAELILTFTSNTLDRSCICVNAGFVAYQIIIDSLLQIKPSPSDIQDLILELRKTYADNNAQLKQVDEFYNSYVSEKALWWYTKDTVFYRLLNWALRVQNIELLYLFRFFIRDIQMQLFSHQWPKIVRVYRAQLIAKQELVTLASLIDQNICFKSFLSASLSREIAEFYLGAINPTEQSYNEYENVIFEIDADSATNTNSQRPFAEISQFSAFGYVEEEILFMLGSVFHVNDVCRENNVWTIKMILWKYEDHDWNNVSATIQFNLGDQTEMDPTHLFEFCSLLLNLGEDNLAEKLIQKYLHDLLLSNGDHQNTLQISGCYHKLGHCALNRKKSESALEWFDKALKLFTTFLPQNHLIVAAIYLSKGNALSAIKDGEGAYKSYKNALSIYKQYYSEESIEIQTCYANIRTFDVDNQMMKLFHQSIRSEECLSNSCEAIEINNEEDLALYPATYEEWKQKFAVDRSLVTAESESPLFREQTRLITKNVRFSLFNQSTISRLLSRFTCPIIIYTCPCCKRRVWVYKVFGMFKGSPCFLCIRRTLSFGPGTVRQ